MGRATSVVTGTTGTGGKGATCSSKDAADKMVEGMSESGKDPDKPLKR
jgi:hypothetical protein